MKIILLLLFPLCAPAQTNTTRLVTTNWVTAAPSFREVNGRLYNSERSKLWQYKDQLHFVRMEGDIVIAKQITQVETYDVQSVPGRVDRMQSSGLFTGSPGSYSAEPRRTKETLVSSERQEGPPFAITNCQIKTFTVGQEFTAVFMRNGFLKSGGQNLELWDCGTPHIVAVITTNSFQNEH